MFLLSLRVCRRVRDKYESELKELEESERNMQDKYNSMKVRVGSALLVPRELSLGQYGVVGLLWPSQTTALLVGVVV